LREVRIGRVVIDAPREYDGVPQARETIRAGIEQRLKDDGSATLERERDAAYVLHVRIGPALEPGADEAGDKENRAPARLVQVRLRPTASDPLYETGAVAPGDDPVASVLLAFDDAWQVLKRQRRLEGAADEALVAALQDEDMRLRDFAIVRLGDRKSHAAVMPLCHLLEVEPKAELVLRAIGSLVAIGDARAVEPLIDISKRKSPDFVIQIVFAVGAIGGRTAEGYLVTMASGHPVDAVRRSAEQALSEIKKTARR
jgi:hypothetical protein